MILLCFIQHLHILLEGASADLNRAVFGLTSGQLYTAVKLAALDDDLTGAAFIKFCTQSVAIAIQITGITTIRKLRLTEFHAVFDRNIAVFTTDGIKHITERNTLYAKSAALQCQAAVSSDKNQVVYPTAFYGTEKAGDRTGFGGAAVLDSQASSYYLYEVGVSYLHFQMQGFAIQVKNKILILKVQKIACIHGETVVQRTGVNVPPQLDVLLLVFDCRMQFLKGIDGRPFRRARRHAHGGHEGEQHHQRQKQAGNSFSHVFSSSFIERLVDLPRFCPRPAAAG